MNPDLVAQLKGRLDALGDGRDTRSDNERAAYRRDYDALQRCLSGLLNAPDAVARAERTLATVAEARTVVVAKQAEIAQQLAEAPDWRSVADGRQRDKEYDRQQDLRRQLARLQDGTLLAAPDVCYERLADLDARIAQLTDRRDRAQHALDGHLTAAQALLAAPVAAHR